ncbi:helix-turn-helix domain-containing protein [Flavisericum labens]|uniref:helix-turn-helix domain-containing protein n=1 Tax=Flavisericum labens TaxID=3377112 RepID=UPI00387B474E
MGSLESMEESFISKLNGVLEDNYHKESFGVSELAASMGISRSQLHRKIRKIKGVSASEFIKIFRLQKGYILLKNNTSTVSEIAYSVGFSSPSYFTKCFHKQYNCSPTELKNKLDSGILFDETEISKVGASSSQLTEFSGNKFFKRILHFGAFRVQTYKLVVLFLFVFTAAVFYNSVSGSNEQGPKSLAILPIEVKTKSIDRDVLSEGIHEGLASSLGKLNRLNVLSRATTEKYKKSKLTKENIIKELGVDFLVYGKAYYSDKDSLVLNVTVYKMGASEEGFQTLNYNTSIENIIAVQNEVSKRIGISTGSLHVLGYSNLNQHNRKVNKKAYKNYIRGMYYLHKSSQEDFDRGIRFLYEAIDADPAEPLAYAGLAYGYVILGHSSSENSNVFGKAKMAANKAIQLDSTLLEAYASMAGIGIYHDRNWNQAEDLFRYILSINPSMANVHYDYAWYCLLVGEKEKALYHHEMAEKLDPFNAKYIAWTGWMLAYYGDYKRAMDKVETSLQIAPNNTVAYLAKGFIYELQENTIKALEAYEKLYSLSSRHGSSLGSLYAEIGELEKAHKILEEVKNWPESPWKNYNLAHLYAGLNDADNAVKMLETDPKHAYVAWAAVMPAFKGIEHHNGFKAFVSSLKLPNR